MAGRTLTSQGVRTRTNWMALVAIFVLTVGVGIGWAGAVNENFYWLGFAGVVSLGGIGCAVLALGDDR